MWNEMKVSKKMGRTKSAQTSTSVRFFNLACENKCCIFTANVI